MGLLPQDRGPLSDGQPTVVENWTIDHDLIRIAKNRRDSLYDLSLIHI